MPSSARATHPSCSSIWRRSRRDTRWPGTARPEAAKRPSILPDISTTSSRPMPAMQIEHRFTVQRFLGYVRTWSATTRLIAERGEAPVQAFEHALLAEWGDPEVSRVLRWPLVVLAGRV